MLTKAEPDIKLKKAEIKYNFFRFEIHGWFYKAKHK